MSHLRITGGQARGRKISVPQIQGVRPSPDRARTTLFNWLMAFPPPQKALDLFCGTGILGFEALSRGASDVHFVDKNAKIIQQLKASSATWPYGKLHLHTQDCIKWLHQNQHLAPFELIFVDAPFDQPALLKQTLDTLADLKFLHPQGALYFEQSQQQHIALPSIFQNYREKKIGQVRSTVIQLQREASGP